MSAHTGGTGRPKQRVLKECFTNAHDAAYLNHYLKQALTMSEQHSETIPTPLNWVEFAEQAVQTPLAVYKLYTLLVWVVILPPFRVYLRTHDETALFDKFYDVLCVQLDRLLLGLRADGVAYATDGKAKLYEHSVGFFVDRLRTVYMTENYNVL